MMKLKPLTHCIYSYVLWPAVGIHVHGCCVTQFGFKSLGKGLWLFLVATCVAAFGATSEKG